MVTKFQLSISDMSCGQQECWPSSTELTRTLEPEEFVNVALTSLLSLEALHGDTCDNWLPVSLKMDFNKVMLMVLGLLQ